MLKINLNEITQGTGLGHCLIEFSLLDMDETVYPPCVSEKQGSVSL